MNDKKIDRLAWILAVATVLFLLLMLSSCAATAVSESGLPYDVERYVDTEAQVVCWMFGKGFHAGGLSCIPLADTALEE